MTFSERQLRALEVTDRATSSFSIVGSLFVISTYCASSAFQKPINRLVFYASWGNLVANVATLMSRSGMQAGLDSPMCQTQAFIIQM